MLFACISESCGCFLSDRRIFFQPFQKFVEIGRVVVLQDGPDHGKIAAVVNVIDQNRVLIDGPGVARQEFRIKNVHLTPLCTKFPFAARSKVVRKAWEAEKISEKWAESAWAKRMQMKVRRQGLNDFDRFKLFKAKSARNKILAKAVNIKKNKLSKAGKL